MGSANWLILNVNETNIVKFTASKLSFNPLTIVYDGKLLSEELNFKFPSLHVDKHLNWGSNIEKLLPNWILSVILLENYLLSWVLKFLELYILQIFNLYLNIA